MSGKKIIRSSNPEIDGCFLIEDLLPGECDCGGMLDVHQREASGCEYHDHHCKSCHETGRCTKTACLAERKEER